jgi:hypothetical protein
MSKRKLPSSYVAVPVEAAKAIADQYGKSIVIIFAHDPVHGVLHTTTYGRDPQEKAWAAQGGEIATKALGGVLELGTSFEDYRLRQAQALLTALESALKVAKEVFDGWYKNRDVQWQRSLQALAEPETRRGYRADIDAIHDIVREAKKYLTGKTHEAN